MANRAYLYSASKDLAKLRDLSESRYPIPLVYKIILGVDTMVSNSKIWEYEHPIAIIGDFTKGLQRLYDFYDYLETQEALDRMAITMFHKKTKDFFAEHKDRMLEVFFLEGGEIFDMIGDMEPIQEQNKALFNEILAISNDISDILATKPSNVLEYKDSHWLAEIKKEVNVIDPYWTYVTYFSFNKS